MLARIGALLSVVVLLFALLPGMVQQTPPREHFQNVDILYDWVSNSRGDKLRTFITRPIRSGKAFGTTRPTGSMGVLLLFISSFRRSTWVSSGKTWMRPFRSFAAAPTPS